MMQCLLTQLMKPLGNKFVDDLLSWSSKCMGTFTKLLLNKVGQFQGKGRKSADTACVPVELFVITQVDAMNML